jgi:pimeloyl-ACP methyl ester carboxylesterase
MVTSRQLYLSTDTGGKSWPTWYTMARLMLPGTARRDEVHILVHGAGIDHRYWDWPIEPQRYSYVDWAARNGIATLNLDRIGCGHSSHPPGVEVTLQTQAHTLVQLLDAVRAGAQGIRPFSRVVLIGHSMGSVVAGAAVASGADCDALIMTGYLPVDGTTEMGDELFEYAFTPALSALPGLRGIVDADYLAARSDLGVDELRYWAPQTDPDILAAEKLLRGPATRAELRDAALAGPLIRTIAAPTLALVGQRDCLLIDASQGDVDTSDAVNRISPGIGPNFAFEVVPDTGHMLNLQRNAHNAFELMEGWLAT